MDDTLRNIGLGLFSFLLLHGSLHERARRAAHRQVAQGFGNTGTVRVNVSPRGFFGLELNDLYSVDVSGSHQNLTRLPFYVYPRLGQRGQIHHLRLYLKDFTLAGLPVQEFKAEFLHATYDLGHVLYRNKLVLRTAQPGPAVVLIGSSGIQKFIAKKYGQTLSDVKVVFASRTLSISGNVKVLGLASPFSATGRLAVRAGRYIDLSDPIMRMNGVEVSKQFSDSLLRQINPVLDTDLDLGLGGYFIVDAVEVGDEDIKITGQASIPVAPSNTPLP